MTKDRYLFRGFHKEENGKETIYIDGQAIKGKWVFGYYQKVKHFLGFKDLHYIVDDKQETYEVIPETIGQYTGITDMNGKKIFENDVCKGNSYSLEGNFIIKFGKYKTDDWKEKFSAVKTCQFGWYAEYISSKSQVHLVSPNGIHVLRTIFDKEVKE